MTPTLPISKAKEFRAQIANRVMVADGAMGTVLYAKGVFINRSFDALNISQPELVGGVHDEYIRAGAAAVGIGADLIHQDAIKRREASWIRELARRYVHMVREARAQLKRVPA